jgi:hypothetical protein
MSSFFITNGRPVAVSDDDGNTVWVLPKMGIGVEAAVSADFIKLGGKAINAYQLCLLRHNVLRWAGPGFTSEDGVVLPCVPSNIDKLQSPLPPIMAAVLEKINELNRPATADPSPGEPAEDTADPTPADVAT